MAFNFSKISVATVSDFDDLWTTDTDSSIKIEETFSTNEDLITISCVLYRLMTTAGDEDNAPGRFLSLEHDVKKLTESINSEDRLLSQSIRRYYNGKLMTKRLRGETFSKFRQDLSNLLNVQAIDGKFTYFKSYLGMSYKLPYFYDNDQSLVEVFGSEYFELAGKKEFKGVSTLSFIKKLDAFQKRNPKYEYWFSDENDDRVLLQVEKNNPLVSVFDNYLLDKDIKVSGKFVATNRDTLNYYKSEWWKVEF